MKRITSTMLAVMLVVVALLSVACQQPSTTGKKYSVVFETFDGKSTVVEVIEGQTARQPDDPNNQQATFQGWYVDKDYQTPWNKSTPITANTVVYAKWDYKYNVTATFELNNGEEAFQEVLHTGFLVTLPANPTRAYYEFAGWYTDAKCSKKFDETKVLSYRSAFTLYAGWTLSEGHIHDFKFDKTVKPTCEAIGYDVYSCICGTSEHRNVVQPLGHKAPEGDDYIRFYTCSVCPKTLRRQSLRTYDEVFKYEFSQEKADEYDLLYQEILDILEEADEYSDTYKRTWNESTQQYDSSKDVDGLYDENKAFEDKFNAYYDKVLDVIEQYQYAYVFYCVHDGESAYEEDYEFVSEYRTDMVKNFYSLYRLIYNTKFREFFFAFDEGWTDEDIQSALVLSDSYGDEEYAELNKKADDIQVSFRAISNTASSSKVLTLYSQFVDVNNQIAKLAGYDNYMDYAYENVYDRDYTPADVAVMRNYVKEYIAPLFSKINTTYSSYRKQSLKGEESNYYKAVSQKSIFTTPLTAELVADYFDLLNSPANQAGKKEINFAKHANDLFKNGNYYTGNYEGAFSYFIRAQETSILYFGPDSYSGAFTFVHEFGHYYETVYNPGVGISYDLEETHSQGDEMLFLSHVYSLFNQKGYSTAASKLLYDQIWNSMAIVLLATAVDEFEQIAYTGKYAGTNQVILNVVADDIVAKSEYDRIFTALMEDYGISDVLNDAYWRYVTIEAAGYYISYAMSALPAIELFVKGVQDFDSAKQSYFKLFTFTDNDEFVELDEQGDLVVTAGYAETLQYAGLYSPFQEGLYTTLSNYFESL